EVPKSGKRRLSFRLRHPALQLARFPASAGPGFLLSIDNRLMRGLFQYRQRRVKMLQFLEGLSTDLVAGIAVERHFDDAVPHVPRNRLSREALHKPLTTKGTKLHEAKPTPTASPHTFLRSLN